MSHEFAGHDGFTDPTTLRDIVADTVEGFVPTAEPDRLPGGLMNAVWRLPGRPESVVAKQAASFVADDPDVSVDERRAQFEAEALALFDGGLFDPLATDRIRPPELLAYDPDRHLVVMEDLGDLPALDTWLPETAPDAARSIGDYLGDVIGHLHVRSRGDETLADTFDNTSVQETRYEIQYRPVGDRLADAGIERAADAGDRARELGQRLVQPGRCLTMGDLWPRSILVDDGAVRLIDWEFSHFGHPAQDVAHLAAHLWMLAHRLDPTTRPAVRATAEGFGAAYRSAIATEPPPSDDSALLVDPASRRDAATHFGAEVLARTLGAFRDGYLYEGLGIGDAPFDEAVRVAVDALADGELPDVADRLLP